MSKLGLSRVVSFAFFAWLVACVPSYGVAAGRVDINGGVTVSPAVVTIGSTFTVSFSLQEYQGSDKLLDYVQVWIQDSSGNDLYDAYTWNSVAFSGYQERNFSTSTYLDPARGRQPGNYRAIVRGKAAGDPSIFNFGVVVGSGAVNPTTFTAVNPVGDVAVNPSTGTWTSSPQSVAVSSSNAARIYYTIRTTLDGTTPQDPPLPSTTANDGYISGSSPRRPPKLPQ